jgi:hypothetical protein
VRGKWGREREKWKERERHLLYQHSFMRQGISTPEALNSSLVCADGSGDAAPGHHHGNANGNLTRIRAHRHEGSSPSGNLHTHHNGSPGIPACEPYIHGGAPEPSTGQAMTWHGNGAAGGQSLEDRILRIQVCGSHGRDLL